MLECGTLDVSPKERTPMAKHEVVNDILEYLDQRRTDLSNEMASVAYESNDYVMLDAMYEVYDHLIAKLEDDYR